MMSRKNFGAIAVAAVTACVTTVGIARADGVAEPYRDAYRAAFKDQRVVFVPVAGSVDLVKGWMAGLHRELDPLGAKVEIRDPNYDTNAGAQAITSLISEKPAVIIIQNPDVSSYARLAKQAEAAGIHVVQINMASNYVSDSYVGADWAEIGEMGANAMVKACEGKSGKVAVIQGALSAATSSYQIKAIRDVLAKHPEMKIVSDQPADWDTSKAKAIMSTVLKQNPDLCAAFGFWDGMDLGAAAAIAEAGLTGKVFLGTSGGGEMTACKRVKDGTFDLDVSYDVPNQAAQLAGSIKYLLSSKIAVGLAKGMSYTTPVLITKENASDPATCWKIAQ